MQHFCKMRHHMRPHFHVLTSKFAWTYGQTRSLVSVEHRRPLVTLDPEKILGQRPRDISDTHDVSYTVQTNKKFVQGIGIRYVTENRRYIPFPKNTRGFLYYQRPKPGYPDFSGTLRFRVVSGPDSNSFEEGVDLKLPSGAIWEIHLSTIIRNVRHHGFITKLLEEGLVSTSTLEKLQALSPAILRSSSQILYKLDDPFVAKLHAVESLVIMSQNGAESGQIMPMFLDSRSAIHTHPYKGTVTVRFERSTLPEHANTRTLVLRILETLSPIECVLEDYDFYLVMPTPGKLLSRNYERKGNFLRPWSIDLDTGKGKATRMLSLLWKDP